MISKVLASHSPSDYGVGAKEMIDGKDGDGFESKPCPQTKQTSISSDFKHMQKKTKHLFDFCQQENLLV